MDQWYACITTDDGIDFIKKKPIENAVGVDLGLTKSVVLSTGDMMESPKPLKQSIQQIKNLQRSLARKQKDSKNRKKTRVRLAKAWRRVRNQRQDYAHKISAKLAAEYDTIVFEDLRISNMVKNHSLTSAIMDATWSKLRQLTAYKVERRGGNIIDVDPRGTSQKCSGCGHVVEKDLSVRVHRCTTCKLVIDRDRNAALNILKLGLERAHVEAEPLLVRRISKFSQGSKKPQNEVVHPSPVKVRY